MFTQQGFFLKQWRRGKNLKGTSVYENIFIYLGNVHILRNHKGEKGGGGSLKCLPMIMGEGEGAGLMIT